MVKELSTKEPYVNKSIKKKKLIKENFNEINKDSYKNLVIKEILELRNFIKNKNMYIKYYLIVRLTYEILLKESIRNIKIFKKPIDLIDLNLDIYNTYNPLKNGDIIIVIAFILFKNKQWIHIKTTGKEGWVLLNNDVADCMKLF